MAGRHKGTVSAREKNWGHQLLLSWGRDHTPRSQDGATMPFCFGSAVEELEQP